MRPWPLLLILPLATAGVLQVQEVDTNLAAATPPATLIAGDHGSATIGTSGSSASVTASVPVLVDDILRLDSNDASWQAHIEHVSNSGWSVLESVTISLDDGVLPRNQIDIVLGVLSLTEGIAVDVPTGTDSQIRIVGTGTGSISFDVVLTPDGASSPEIRYRVDWST